MKRSLFILLIISLVNLVFALEVLTVTSDNVGDSWFDLGNNTNKKIIQLVKFKNPYYGNKDAYIKRLHVFTYNKDTLRWAIVDTLHNNGDYFENSGVWKINNFPISDTNKILHGKFAPIVESSNFNGSSYNGGYNIIELSPDQKKSVLNKKYFYLTFNINGSPGNENKIRFDNDPSLVDRTYRYNQDAPPFLPSKFSLVKDIHYLVKVEISDEKEETEIHDYMKKEDFQDFTINLSTHPFGLTGKLSYSVDYESSALNCSIVEDTLKVSSVANWNGISKVTIHASNGSNQESISLDVIVANINDNPVIKKPIPDFVKDEDFQTFTLDLNEYFEDIDGDNLTFYPQYDLQKLSASVGSDGHTLSISSVKNWHGNVEITVVADDFDGNKKRLKTKRGTISDKFIVKVNPLNDAPQITNPNPYLISLNQNSNLEFDVSVTDEDDAESFSWFISKSGLPTNGKIDFINKSSSEGSKRLRYTPTYNFSGKDSFVVVVKDGNLLSDSVRVIATIKDTQAPEVNFINITSGEIVSGHKIIEFSGGEDRSEISIDNYNWVNADSGVTKLEDITGFTDLEDKSFILYLRSFDASSNVGNNNISLEKDGTGPTFVKANISPNNIDRIDAEFNENIFVNGFLGFSVEVDGSPVNILSVSGSGSKVLSFTIKHTLNHNNNVKLLYLQQNNAYDSLNNVLLPFGPVDVNNSVEDLPPSFDNIDKYSVKEGETASFNVVANDPDGDPVKYYLGSGQISGMEIDSISGNFTWTPNYDSSGEYSVNIIAKSGSPLLLDTAVAKISVLDVDREIIITFSSFQDGDTIKMTETEDIFMKINGYDPDGNDVHYNWSLDGSVVSTDSTYKFVSSYNDAGIHSVNVVLNDGQKSSATRSAFLSVKDNPRPPVLASIGDKNTQEGEILAFKAIATDPDGDPIQYSLKTGFENGMEINPSTGIFNWYTNYESAGSYQIGVIASSGSPILSDTVFVNINVADVDQTIIVDTVSHVDGSIINIAETDTVSFFVKAHDPDNNKLTYKWTYDNLAISNDSTFQFISNYNSAGIHLVKVIISDGQKSSVVLSYELNITDVPRAPQLSNISDQIVSEGDTAIFFAKAIDPDGDLVEYLLGKDAHSDMLIDSLSGRFTWVPNYEAAGKYKFSVIARSGVPALFDTTNVNIDVIDVDQKIIIDSASYANGSDVIISENDTLKMYIAAHDPDHNNLSYMWIYNGIAIDNDSLLSMTTGYEDAGEYDLTVSISDGQKSIVSYNYNIKIQDVPRAPVLDPIPNQVVNENDTLSFVAHAIDLDGDSIFYHLGQGATNKMAIDSLTGEFKWTTDYTDAGDYLINLIASSGMPRLKDTTQVNIKVLDTDQGIVVLQSAYPNGDTLIIDELDSLFFFVTAKDPDGNKLSYEWKLDNSSVSTDSSYWFYTDFNSSGLHDLTFSANDGQKAQLSYSYTILVNDSDRAPILEEIVDQNVKEGDSLALKLKAIDLDNDTIFYHLGEGVIAGMSLDSLSGNFGWYPDYNSAGEYQIEVIAASGNPTLYDTVSFKINVQDVDQGIIIDSVAYANGDTLSIQETDSLMFYIAAHDPDGKTLHYQWKLNNDTISTDSIYWFYTGFNSAGDYNLNLLVSDSKKSDINYSYKIIVQDKDRAPVLDSIPDIVVTEEDTIKLLAKAIDPDGDSIFYYLGQGSTEVMQIDSLTGEFRWITNSNDAGQYKINIIAKSGVMPLSDTTSVNIHIHNLVDIVIDSLAYPDSSYIAVNEMDSLTMFVKAKSLTNKKIKYKWFLDDIPTVLDSVYIYKPDYYQNGNHTIKVYIGNENKKTINKTNIISREEICLRWYVEVKNVNAPPLWTEILDQNLIEGDTLSLNLEAEDPDGDSVIYHLIDYDTNLNIILDSLTGKFTWISGYKDANNSTGGYYTFKVRASSGKEVSDQLSSDLKFNAIIADFDRNIVIDSISYPDSSIVNLTELDSIKFSVLAHDPDGDPVNYTWELNDKLVSNNNSYNLRTDYGDQGIKNLKLKISSISEVVNINYQIVIGDASQNYKTSSDLKTPNILRTDVPEMSQIIFKKDEEITSVRIFTNRGKLVKKLSLVDGYYRWNGFDTKNNAVGPGVYVYQIKTSKKVVRNGFIGVIR